jgi:hypothetical protein
MVSKVVYGGMAAAGAVGGFLLDRSIADTPYRVDKRIPQIARVNVTADRYDNDETPDLAGGGVNAAVFWGPVGGTVASLVAVSAVKSITPRDRVWQQTIAGRGAIGAAVVGASMAAGALVSRSVLG